MALCVAELLKEGVLLRVFITVEWRSWLSDYKCSVWRLGSLESDFTFLRGVKSFWLLRSWVVLLVAINYSSRRFPEEIWPVKKFCLLISFTNFGMLPCDVDMCCAILLFFSCCIFMAPLTLSSAKLIFYVYDSCLPLSKQLIMKFNLLMLFALVLVFCCRFFES